MDSTHSTIFIKLELLINTKTKSWTLQLKDRMQNNLFIKQYQHVYRSVAEGEDAVEASVLFEEPVWSLLPKECTS